MVWKAIDRRIEDPSAEEAPDLSEQTVRAIHGLLDRYPTRRAALLPALHLAQEQIGHLPNKTLLQIAELVEMPPAELLDVVSFYEMFRRRPRGRKLVQVCEGFCCELCGQAGLLEAIKTRLGIDVGETTPDGEFTLIAVPCLAACDKAPVVLVDDRLYERVTVGKLGKILKVDGEGDRRQESGDNRNEGDSRGRARSD